jgi:hypothetical protein
VRSTHEQEAQQDVGEQPPISFSVSAQSLSNGGGATTLTFCWKLNAQPPPNSLANLPSRSQFRCGPDSESEF